MGEPILYVVCWYLPGCSNHSPTYVILSKLTVAMVQQQAMVVLEQQTETFEPVNDLVAKALLRSTNELARVKLVNDILKTQLTKTRMKFESMETELFKINGHEFKHAQTRRGWKNCMNPNCAMQLASALDRVTSLEGQLAQAMAELDLQGRVLDEHASKLICSLCMDDIPRAQRMVTKCCRRFDACASCFAEWVDDFSPDNTCPFCRKSPVE